MLTIRQEKVRRILRFAIPLLLIPLTVFLGAVVFDAKQHLYVSFAVVFLSLLLFVAGYEKKRIGTRRLVITAVLTAFSVIGRFIPFFKPITALTILAGVYLGGEAGFLVGALSAFLSDIWFGMGPWTSFQMLAWGLIGLLAGGLAGLLKKSKPALLAYGVLSGAAYSFMMDIWTVLSYNGHFTFPLYFAALLTALPHTLLYAASNFVFLFFMARPFGEKLERIKIKYGV